MFTRTWFLSTSLCFGLLVAPVGADVLEVPADHATIQGAINAAVNGDEILVAPGVHTGSGDVVVDLLGKEIVLRSSGGFDVTYIDGEGTRRGITCRTGEGPATVVDGFTIIGCTGQWEDLNTDGVEDAFEYVGGGLLAWYASPTIRNCTFSLNDASRGGGAFGHWTNASFVDCSFEENDADSGGAMYMNFFSTPSLDATDFLLNTGSFGGGIYAAYGSEISLVGCRLEANQAAGNGGGCYGLYSDFFVQDCRFLDGSTDGSGGAFYGFESGAVLLQCYLEGNTGVQSGGAIRFVGGDGDISECIFLGNTSLSTGGGLKWTGSSLSILRCTFRSNFASDGGAVSIDGVSSTGDLALVQSSSFSQNDSNRGGAIAIQGEIEVQLHDTILNANTAVLEGGAVYNEAADLSIGESLFCNNDPDTPGDIAGEWEDLDGNEFPEDCPVIAIGACCSEDSCYESTEQHCIAEWRGAGTRCEDGCTSCVGDIDGSGVVDVFDLLMVISSWGPCPAGCDADVNADQLVNVLDLLMVIDAWGECD